MIVAKNIKKRMSRPLFIVLLGLLPFLTRAQSFEIGATGGLAFYSGDLSRDWTSYLEDAGLSGGIFLRMRVSNALSVRAGLAYARVAGNEARAAGTLDNGLFFYSPIGETSLMGEWRMFNLYLGNVRVSPYVAFGAAGFYFDPRLTLDGLEIRLRPLGTEGQGLAGYPAPYSPFQLSVPVGGGLHFALNDRWGIGVELIGRRSQTDYLDDVSAQDVGYWDVLLARGALAAYISNPTISPDIAPNNLVYQRGGIFTDWYYTAGLALSYRMFGNVYSRRSNVPCYKF